MYRGRLCTCAKSCTGRCTHVYQEGWKEVRVRSRRARAEYWRAVPPGPLVLGATEKRRDASRAPLPGCSPWSATASRPSQIVRHVSRYPSVRIHPSPLVEPWLASPRPGRARRISYFHSRSPRDASYHRLHVQSFDALLPGK